MKNKNLLISAFVSIVLISCLKISNNPTEVAEEEKIPHVLFIGADISGSFLKSSKFEDGLDFLAYYIHSHLKGYGGLSVPEALFVGAIGGTIAGEPKTLFPIQTFENESLDGVRRRLAAIFPKHKPNPHTDFNAFFNQISNTVKARKLILKPITVVLLTDGKPDVSRAGETVEFRSIDVSALETLSRNVTLRVLYTDAVTGMHWQTKVPRKRVKIWTQDAAVMIGWRDPKTLLPAQTLPHQSRFFNWVKENVDFAVSGKRVN